MANTRLFVLMNNPRGFGRVFELALQLPNVAAGNFSSGFRESEIRPLLLPYPSWVSQSLSFPFSLFPLLPCWFVYFSKGAVFLASTQSTEKNSTKLISINCSKVD